MKSSGDRDFTDRRRTSGRPTTLTSSRRTLSLLLQIPRPGSTHQVKKKPLRNYRMSFNQQRCWNAHVTATVNSAKMDLWHLHKLYEAISPVWKKRGGIKPTLSLWPLEEHSYITILHACALTFSNTCLKVACSCVCGLRRLCRSSRLSESTSLSTEWPTKLLY